MRTTPAIIDGFLLSGAKLVRFRHNDMTHLERRLEAYADHNGAKLIAVDGVYSMTGEIAPLPALVALAKKHSARLLVDEAHAVGVLGPGGRGITAHFGLLDEVDLITGTFSKSFASMGGFIGCPTAVKDSLMHHSRQLMYIASVTPSVVATVLAALRILREQPERVEQVRSLAAWMRTALEAMGFNCRHSDTAVVPIVVGSMEPMLHFNHRLFEEGVFANPVLPPAVPTNACLIRTSYMATHDRKDLQDALDIFERVGKEVGVIGEKKAEMDVFWALMKSGL